MIAAPLPASSPAPLRFGGPAGNLFSALRSFPPRTARWTAARTGLRSLLAALHSIAPEGVGNGGQGTTSPSMHKVSWESGSNGQEDQHSSGKCGADQRSPNPHHLAVLARPGFVRAAPTDHGTSRDRLPSASPPCYDRDGGEGLSPPLKSSAPHGAPGSWLSATLQAR